MHLLHLLNSFPFSVRSVFFAIIYHRSERLRKDQSFVTTNLAIEKDLDADALDEGALPRHLHRARVVPVTDEGDSPVRPHAVEDGQDG